MSRKKKISKKSDKQTPLSVSWRESVLKRWKSPKTPYVLLALILILASALRIYKADQPLMWMDEIYSLGVSTGQYQGHMDSHFPLDVVVKNPANHSSIKTTEPISTTWKYHREFDVHPPLYHTLLHFWRILFGDSYISVRVLSIGPSILSIVVLFFLGSRIFDKTTGLWAALLMCLATPQIVYAQEVRGYSLLISFGISAALVLIDIEQSGPKLWSAISLVLLSFCLAFTHYFSFGLLVALSIYSLIRLRGKSLACMIGSFAIGAVIFLVIWGPSFWQQFFGESTIRDHYLATRQDPSVAQHCFEFLAGWPERLFLHLPPEYLTRPPLLIFLYLLPGVAIFWKRELLLPWIWAICTAGFVWGMDYRRDTFHFIEIRYTLLAAPAVYMLVAAGLFRDRRYVVYNSILPCILSIFLIFQIPKAYISYKESWFELSELIKKNGGPNDVIILPHAGTDIQVYWPQIIWTAISYYNYNPGRPMAIPSKPLTNEMMEQIGWGRNAWILTHVPDFPQSASMDWPAKWIPGCKVLGATVAQGRATVFYVTLPEAPLRLFTPSDGN